MTPLLAVNNIEVVYAGTVQVLRGLSLSVQPGRIMALLGANGAGKTTALKAICNLLALENGAVTAGHITFDGADIAASAPHLLVRQGLFHVMEGRRVFEDLTVAENLAAASFALSGRPGAKPDYDLVYGYFPRLAERRGATAGYLSGGEQQMLAIGRALVARPRLMLLDEPSLGLAPMVVDEIFRIIARINAEQGVAMLLVEQNAMQAFAVAHHATIMEGGKVVTEGPVETLLRDADVREFYLGLATESGSRVKFRDAKHYKRRKRWLS
jgi:branched-chain amino acid transport system ATP-binding protein